MNLIFPRTSVKLFTRYRLPAIPELTVGGGVFGRIGFTKIPRRRTAFRAPNRVAMRWSSVYPLSGDENFSVRNISNLFDKTYDTNIDGSIVYGRVMSASANYQF